jgi:hypothetical protein
MVCTEECVPMSGALLQDQVVNFHKEIGSTGDFNASNGWLSRWKVHHGVTEISTERESRSDSAAAREFSETSRRCLMSMDTVKINCKIVTTLHSTVECF